MPRGRPRKNFGLKNFGLIFRSLAIHELQLSLRLRSDQEVPSIQLGDVRRPGSKTDAVFGLGGLSNYQQQPKSNNYNPVRHLMQHLYCARVVALLSATVEGVL